MTHDRISGRQGRRQTAAHQANGSLVLASDRCISQNAPTAFLSGPAAPASGHVTAGSGVASQSTPGGRAIGPEGSLLLLSSAIGSVATAAHPTGEPPNKLFSRRRSEPGKEEACTTCPPSSNPSPTERPGPHIHGKRSPNPQRQKQPQHSAHEWRGRTRKISRSSEGGADFPAPGA